LRAAEKVTRNVGILRRALAGEGSRSLVESVVKRAALLDNVPVLFKGTRDEVIAAIAEEKEAIDDYAELENKLRREGLTSEADIVNEIRNDEMDHRVKFEAMLKRMGG